MKTKLIIIVYLCLVGFYANSQGVPGTISSSQTICYNTKPAPFTGTQGMCDGRQILPTHYKWKKSTNGGSTWMEITGAVYQNYEEPNNLTVTTQYKRENLSPTCAITTSNIITVTVHPELTGGTIGSNQTVCADSKPSSFTNISSPTGGTGTYTYSWHKSFDGGLTWSGSLGTSISYTETSNITRTTTYKRVVTSGSCGFANSNYITVNLYAPLTSGSIGSNQTICYNTKPNTINNLTSPTGGTGTITFAWHKSINGGSTWSGSIGTGESYTETANITQTTIYRRVATSGCGSAISNYVTISTYPILTGGSIGSNQTICYNSKPSGFLNFSSPTGGIGTYTYVWQKSIDNGSTWLNITNSNSSTYTETNNLTGKTLYKRIATSGSCGSVESNIVTVNVYPNIVGGSIALNQNVCYNSKPSAFYNTALPTGGNGTYTYVWKKSLNGGSIWTDISGTNNINYTETNNITQTTTYTRLATSGTCGSAYSNNVTATVYEPLTGGSISGTQTIPYNTVPSIINNSDNPTGGTGTYTYAWKKSVDNGSTWVDILGANLNFYNELESLTVTTKYKRIATSGSCGSVESNIITVTVLPNLQGGTIAASQTICYNTIPDPLTNVLSPSGGTGVFTYKWSKSENGGSSWVDIPVINTDYYNCPALTQTTLFKRIATSGLAGSVESNIVTITVLNILTAGSIGENQTIGYNTSPSTFINLVSPTGGTGSYSYVWKKSHDGAVWSDIVNTNTNYYNSEPLTQTTYFKRVVNSGSCESVESNTITVTVMSELTGGSIAGNQSVCYSTVPTPFSNVAQPTGGTGSYTYQWKKSIDGGTTWVDIPGSNNLTYSETSNLTSTHLYKRVATSGTSGTVESNIITVTVYNQLNGGSIGSNQTVCYGIRAESFIGVTSPSGGTGSHTYQWQKSDVNGTTWVDILVANSADYTDINYLTETTKYKRLAIFGCGTVESNVVTVLVHPDNQGGQISGDQTISYNTMPNSFVNISEAVGSGGISYQWQRKESGSSTWSDIIGANSRSYTESSNLTTTTQYKRTAIFGCGTVESNTITVTVLSVLTGGSIAGNQSVCYSTVPTTFSNVAQPTGGTGSYTYQWKKSIDGGTTWTDIPESNNLTYSETGNLTSTHQYKRVVISGVSGIEESNIVTVNVLPELDGGIIGTAQTICNGADALPISGTSPTGANGVFNIQWQSSYDNINWTDLIGETGAQFTPVGLIQSTFFRRVSLNQLCNNSVNSNSIKIDVNNEVVKPVVSVNNYYCKNSNVSLTVLNPNGNTYKWYSSENVLIHEGSQITLPPLINNLEISVVSIQSNGCNSEPLIISVNIDPIKADFTQSHDEVLLGGRVDYTNKSENAVVYEWNFGFGETIFSENPWVYYNQSGTYNTTLVVKSSINCVDTKEVEGSVVVETTTSVGEISGNDVKIFPNPTKGAVRVVTDERIERVYIYNLIGNKIAEFSGEEKIELGEKFAPGIYVFKVQIGGVTKSFKIIKI